MADNRVRLEPGFLLVRDGGTGRGEYRIERAIGGGGFGLTYEAVRLDAGSHPARLLGLGPTDRIAIKEYHPDFARRGPFGVEVDPTSEVNEAETHLERGLERFRREAERLHFLSSVRVLRRALAEWSDEAAARPSRRFLERGATAGLDEAAEALGLVAALPAPLLAQALAAVRTEPLPVVFDFFECRGVSYYAMELLEGSTLRERILAERAAGGFERIRLGERLFKRFDPWPPERLNALAEPLCDALELLHEGFPGQQLVHADLKPGNIMFRTRASTLPVLIDFGLARNIGSDKSRSTLGSTAGFAPIEQEMPGGGRRIGPPTDIYSLAVTLRALACGLEAGAIPPARDRLEALRQGDPDPIEALPGFPQGLPDSIADAIRAGHALEPADRPQRVAEFRALLQARTRWTPAAPASARPSVPKSDLRGDLSDRGRGQAGSAGHAGKRKIIPRAALLGGGAIAATALGFLLLELRAPERPDSPASAEAPPASAGTSPAPSTQPTGPEAAAASDPIDTVAQEPTLPPDAQLDRVAEEPVGAQVAAPAPTPAAPPEPQPASRRGTLQTLGIGWESVTAPAALAQLKMSGFVVRDAVSITSVAPDSAVRATFRVGLVIISDCNEGSAIAALQRADRNEQACVLTSEGQGLTLNAGAG